VIGLNLKLVPDIWDRVLNSVPAFCYYIAHPAHFSFIFLQPTISSKVEEWHLDVEEDDIQDATDINMDEIYDAIDVEEIIKEWQMSVPFINREMKHPCAQFAEIKVESENY
jgi:hypothetical protein